MNTSLAHRYAVMTLTVRMAVLHRHLYMLSRRWLSVSELSCHSPTCQLSTVRRQNTEPWYRTDLQPKNQKTKMNFSANENRFSILRNPGVVSVERLTKEEICELLVQSVVYRKGPLVAINKPQGLSIAGKPELVSLLMLLPELKQQLGVREDLHVVKAATKESSGLVLLSTCHNTTKRIEDFYAECRKISKPVTTYCAVTVGVPNPPEGEIKAFLKIERIGELDLVVPVMNPSKGSLERREVKRTETRYKVLDQATDCALVQLQPFSSFQAQLLVHPTLKFCPLLGDHTYSARVGKILGEDIYVPVDVALPRTQLVDELILRRIHFTQQQMHRMPLHLHLHQLLLPLYPRGGELGILTAPPPPFFQRTLYLLGLNLREKPDCTKDVQHFAGEK